MEFRILGSIEVIDRRAPVVIAGGKQRLLLALLLAERGRRVSRDVLMDALWPTRRPGESTHALDLQVARLRKVIGAERVVTVDGGYRLDTAAATVDADQFSALVDAAKGQPPREAAERLREALALWRGAPFGDLSSEESLRPHAQALSGQRRAALENLFETDLALGRHAAVVHELEALVAQDPLHERSRELLMVALYRSGRQADALRVYDDLRRRLADELGIDPGATIKGVHEAIIRQEPSLAAPGPASDAVHPSEQRRRVWARPALGAALLAAAAILTVVVFAPDRDSEPVPVADGLVRVPVPQESLAFIDWRRGDVLASIPIEREIPDGSAFFAQGRDADWLAGSSGALLQIDPRRYRIARSISLGFPPGGLAVGLGSVWVVANDRPLLVRVEPRYGAVEQRFDLSTKGAARPDLLSGVAIAAGSIWITQGEERVLRIDPRSGRTVAAIKTPGAVALAATDDAVWVSGGDSGRLYKIDPIANAVVTRVPLDPYLCCVAVGGGYVWAMNYRVWKLSSDGRVVSSTPIDGDGANLAWTGEAMWVSEGVSGQDTRIDARNDATRTLRTGGLALFTAVRGDVATVLVGEAPPNLLAGVRGPVARIELAQDWLQPDDPALGSKTVSSLWREQVLDATCARLVTLRRAPPPVGWRVAPEVAALPTSPDDREWTFHIRLGFRFSPPSNAPVTAASMRDTIERALSPKMGSAAAAPVVLNDVLGLRAFRSGKAQHIRGLVVRGDRLVVRLRAPAPDLPLRMTATAFCAVPSRTPASASRFVSTPIPSAGPYYLAQHYGGNAALLRPNPNYRGPREGDLEYLFEMGVQLPAGVDRVASGRADLVVGSGDALRPRSSVARQFGDVSPEAQTPRWSRRLLAATHLLRARTDSGPLASRRVRRAVALALDRAAMAALFDDVPAGRVLPPGVAGSGTARVPNAEPHAARALVGRRRVTLVFGGCRNHPACQALGSLVRTSLRKAGITVLHRPADPSADLAFAEVVMARPDPLGFLAASGGPRSPSPGPAPDDAAALARRLDAELVRTGRVVPFGTPTVGVLVSGRIGCQEALPLSIGDDLTALCSSE